jgi:hypothetical protein
LVVVREIYRRVTVVAGRDEAVGEGLRFVDAFRVEAAPDVAVFIDSDGNLATVPEGRTLRHHVDQAARVRGAVKRGRRAAQDVDAVQQIRVHFPGRETVARLKLQSVEEIAADLRAETANEKPVVAGVVTEGFGADAGRITRRFHDGSRGLILDLFGADHADRLRDFFERHRVLRRA